MEILSPDAAFEALQLSLPPAPKPLGVYKPCLIDGHYLYLSGHGTLQNDGSWIVGIVGLDMDQDAAKLAARQVGLAMLATIKQSLGSLDKIKRVIKVLGMVNAVQGFSDHPFVINGCSEDEDYTSIGAILKVNQQSFAELIMEIIGEAVDRYSKQHQKTEGAVRSSSAS